MESMGVTDNRAGMERLRLLSHVIFLPMIRLTTFLLHGVVMAAGEGEVVMAGVVGAAATVGGAETVPVVTISMDAVAVVGMSGRLGGVVMVVTLGKVVRGARVATAVILP
jgi:hypothetical protein